MNDGIGPPAIVATIAGKPVRFELDTGGAWSFLPAALGDGFPTFKAPIDLVDVAGVRNDAGVKVPELAFGPFKVPNVPFMLGKWPTLGANVLKLFDVEIDPVARKVGLFEHLACDGSPIHWPHSEEIVIPFDLDNAGWITLKAELDGTHLDALLDTGAAMTELDGYFAYRTFHIEVGTRGTEATTKAIGLSGMTVDEYRHQFERLGLGGAVIRNPWIRIGMHRGSFYARSFDPPLTLGMDHLAAFHVFVSYGQKKLYLTTVEGDVAAGRVRAAGGVDALTAQNVRGLIENAANAVKAGDAEAARGNLDRAVALAPDEARALLARAQFLRSRHDDAGAEADLAKVDAMTPVGAQDFLERGDAFMDAGETARGIRDFSRAIELNPGFAMALMHRANAYLLLKDFQHALADATAVEAAAPNRAIVHGFRGAVLLHMGQSALALPEFDAALAIDRRDAFARYGRGLAKTWTGDTAGGQEDLRAALILEPGVDKRFGF